MQTENIVKFIRANYSDERLAALIAHCEDGKLIYGSCCCLIGSANADHALSAEWITAGKTHYDDARLLPYAIAAEREFYNLGFGTDHDDYHSARRERLLPILYAERDRRNPPE